MLSIPVFYPVFPRSSSVPETGYPNGFPLFVFSLILCTQTLSAALKELHLCTAAKQQNLSTRNSQLQIGLIILYIKHTDNTV
jgi:hypothetical protein